MMRILKTLLSSCDKRLTYISIDIAATSRHDEKETTKTIPSHTERHLELNTRSLFKNVQK
jgi:hypothetical protein